MKPKISIIVPVYMVEKYIEKCIDSLINQTYKNIEIILVNDGSLDGCPEICNNYAKNDSRIKVINKKNGGLSDARNAGLREAIGKYILFVDSDDYIEKDTCECFISTIKEREVDVVVGNAKKIENDNLSFMKHSNSQEDQIFTGEQYLAAELKAGTMYMAAWLNLYNRDFLLNNKLEFKVGLLHEDEQFTPRVFLRAEKVIGTNVIFYNYLIRNGSITTTKNKLKNAEHIIRTCKELEQIYCKIKNDELRNLLNDNLVDKYLNIFQVASLHKKENSHLLDEEFLINKAYTAKNKLRVALFRASKTLYFALNKSMKKINSLRL
ncbi:MULTISPECIES: glycosyltransferase [unclassified Bacillus cereus group]|uniref:glycosyltransferase n=1 Tax=unclassified Bacillus cereus group TaxID=2750818 RepID=UPI001F56F41F|nr:MULTISPECIES: glycosyltransferase [unclassified Bacillus cereus group]